MGKVRGCIRVPLNLQLYYIFLIIVGGIHTVIRSKAGVTTAELGDQYCMIGPYNEPTVQLEVEVMEPDLPVMRDVIEGMRKEGVNVVYGRWLIDGYPSVSV